MKPDILSIRCPRCGEKFSLAANHMDRGFLFRAPFTARVDFIIRRCGCAKRDVEKAAAKERAKNQKSHRISTTRSGA